MLFLGSISGVLPDGLATTAFFVCCITSCQIEDIEQKTSGFLEGFEQHRFMFNMKALMSMEQHTQMATRVMLSKHEFNCILSPTLSSYSSLAIKFVMGIRVYTDTSIRIRPTALSLLLPFSSAIIILTSSLVGKCGPGAQWYSRASWKYVIRIPFTAWTDRISVTSTGKPR